MVAEKKSLIYEFLDDFCKIESQDNTDRGKIEDLQWRKIQDLLEPFSPELFEAVKVVSIPHWFDESFFDALILEVNKKDRSSFYQLLKQFSFVEVFSKRKASIHQLTRKIILNHLWNGERDKFMMLSKRAADYLSQLVKDDIPENTVEWLYHLVVVDPNKAVEEIKTLGSSWNNSFRYSDLEFLANTLFERIKENRLQDSAKPIILYRKGRASLHLDRSKEAIDFLTQAKELVDNDYELHADIIESLGESYQLERKNKEAVEFYNDSLHMYKNLRDAVGQANVLQSLGKIADSEKRYEEALKNYNKALMLYKKENSSLGIANTLMEIGDLEQVKEIKDKHYQDALNLYKEINDSLGKDSAKKALNLLRHKPEPQRKKKSPRSRKPKSTISDSREISDVIKRPILTEKATQLLESNQYTFDVPTHRTKLDVKIAIEELFHVRVVSVNTLNPPRKQRRVGKFIGYKPCYKKAIVRLADGHTITFFPEV
jgi:large subunit ribosomal protein L23